MSAVTEETALRALREALGHEWVTEAAETDRVGTSRPRWVVHADGTERAAAALRVAAEHGMSVVPRGGGSKLDRGESPERADLLLDLSAADEVVEHAAGDLVVRAKAGTPLREVQRTVSGAGQQLSLEDPHPTATIGGMIATRSAGPCRYLHGGVRDLIIGITVVCADGTVASSGGKVVKNVAGYDLGKLFTGSYGTLGVVTEAIFRLHPLAEERRWVAVTLPDPRAAAEAARLLRVSRAMPTAVELDRPAGQGPITVCAELEGRSGVTRERAAELARSLGEELGRTCEVSGTAPEWWGRPPGEPGASTGIRMASRPADLAELLEGAGRVEEETGVALPLRGSAGLAVLDAGVADGSSDESVAALVEGIRSRTTALDGHTTVSWAPEGVKRLVDVWGPVQPGALTLMRRTKDQFDPEHRLAPGRFVGGL
ncbi:MULTISPECIES: FAD-binding oxidoreductase [Actinopolyspora]|uniref:Glycolate oxidase FAD binding subunit n=1 Tax=Actinopolyspora saharensis TaxID=995062 RepID=A0A1H1E0X0_9ACTN|nr:MULTISPECIES: FAD-binding oxidoreductase [Actinopolyspora]NHD18670.1 FAD-binding oxidoreductase [Actinopolyspora sp. BKK2]NHE78008.1 FAD-binding oxidoreductase [Actinopolyspora sp. BKK1]SDQ82395.1 glycolate oxidase FAD binding subunit [Actinopolyspora saharensis]